LNVELIDIRALRNIRIQREEKLSYLRQRCVLLRDRIEQAMRDESQKSEQAVASIRQRMHERWRGLFSHDFDSLAVRHAYQADKDDTKEIARIDASLLDLKARLITANAEVAQAASEHAQCLRRLEASNELLAWHERLRARRAAAREEATVDELHGVRNGV